MKILINFKGDPLLKEAIRIVAFNQGHSSSSRIISETLEANPQVAKALKDLQRSVKNKVKAS